MAVHTRKRREKYSVQKWIIARRIARVLRMIPTIQLIGVTGALSLNNATQDDDIDLFFIVDEGTLWLSRLLSTIVVELLGVRRRPRDTEVKNKICLNMFITEDSLELPAGEHDAFAAHEIIQMKPLWDRSGAYRKFLQANSWVKTFLPNAWEHTYQTVHTKSQKDMSKVQSGTAVRFAANMLKLLEPPLKNIQLWYMKQKRTSEVITDGMLRFHPRDMRVRIRTEWGKRLRHYNIPLDKVFYGR